MELGWNMFIVDTKHKDFFLSPSTPPVNSTLYSQLENNLERALVQANS